VRLHSDTSSSTRPAVSPLRHLTSTCRSDVYWTVHHCDSWRI